MFPDTLVAGAAHPDRSATKNGVCRTANAIGVTGVMKRLFQCVDASTKIDMECCPIHD